MEFVKALKRLLLRSEKLGSPVALVPDGKSTEQKSRSYQEEYAGLIENLQSEDPKTRLSALGVLINSMWSKDLGQEADAMRCIASVLKHPDLQMVHKAAGGLAEKGGIATLYMEKAALDPEMSQSARVVVLYRSKMTTAEGYGHSRRREDVGKEGLTTEARKIVVEALTESAHHGFSSFYGGRIHWEDAWYTYTFEIDMQRPKHTQALVSFGQKDDTPMRDDICLPLVKAFAGTASFTEISDIPTEIGLRYFGWAAPEYD